MKVAAKDALSVRHGGGSPILASFRGTRPFVFLVLQVCCVQGLVSQRRPLQEVNRISATEHDLSTIGAVAAAPDGTMWISQPQDGDVIGLRPGSHVLQHIGGPGEGPGTFRAMSQIVASNDSLWVFDRTLRRGTWFTADGQLLSTTVMRSPPNLRGVASWAGGPDGIAVWRRYANGALAYFVANYDGSNPHAVGEATLAHCGRGVRVGNSQMSIAIPFCHHAVENVSGNAKYRAVAIPVPRNRDSVGVRVIVIGMRGDTTIDRLLSLVPSPISASVRDSTEAALRAKGGALAAVAKQMIEDGDIPSDYSPVVGLEVSGQGQVLLTVRRGKPAGISAQLVESTTSRVIEFLVDPTWEIRWFDEGRFIVAESDQDGLQDAVLYQVLPTR